MGWLTNCLRIPNAFRIELIINADLLAIGWRRLLSKYPFNTLLMIDRSRSESGLFNTRAMIWTALSSKSMRSNDLGGMTPRSDFTIKFLLITDIGSLTSVWATCSTCNGGSSGGGGDGVESVLSGSSARGGSGEGIHRSASTEVIGGISRHSSLRRWWTPGPPIMILVREHLFADGQKIAQTSLTGQCSETRSMWDSNASRMLHSRKRCGCHICSLATPCISAP